MSRDLKIEKICDHQILEEQVQIQDDLKTILIPRTLASSNVTLYINDCLMKKDDPKNGWAIEEDLSSRFTKKSKIVLKYPRKSNNDYYYITYQVQPKYCPKCIGLSILNDVSYSKLGKPVMVENEEKLLQEVKKGLATELGSNPFHTWIGTKIYQMVGSKIYNVETIKGLIIQEITRYLEKYLDIQIQQSQYQIVSDRESFLQTLSIEITPQYDIDVSYWTITIIFQNRTGADMLYEKEFKIPGPADLLYGKKSN